MQPQVPMPVAAPVTYANHQYGGVGQSRRMTFSRKGMQICAILMLVLGAVSIVLGITRITIPARYDVKYIACGVWGGILFIIPGILGVIGCRKEDRCLIVACMAMSIIASLASVNMLGFASVSISFDQYRSKYSPAVAVESLEIMISICTFVVSILLSAICCRATCNCTSPNAPVRVVYVPQHVGPPSGQPVTFLQPTVQQPGAQVTVINPNMAATNVGGGQAVLYRY